MSNSIQGRLAEFISGAPRGWDAGIAWPRVQLALLDTLAVSIAGATDSSVRALRPYLARAGASGAGRGTWVTPPTPSLEHAALVAAACAHALDFDDVTPAWRGHPSAVLLPALTSLGVALGASGTDIADAYAIGFEVGARLGRAVTGQHYERGWHSTATIGAIAAAAACARLARLGSAAASNALGLAATQAAGVQANFGTSAKPLHAGFAAAAAVRSCLLAEAGVTASAHALQGPTGFGDLMASGLDTAAFDALGKAPLALQTPGIEVKLYPACYAAHRAIEAAFELRGSVPFGLDDIASIEISGPKGAHRPLLTRPPTTAAEAKFSAEYLVACAFVHGAVGLLQFKRAPAEDAPVARLMARTRVAESDSTSAVRWATVRLHLAGGETHEATATTLRGNRDGGVAAMDLLSKANDCFANAGVKLGAATLLDDIERSVSTDLTGLFNSDTFRALRRCLWDSDAPNDRAPA